LDAKGFLESGKRGAFERRDQEVLVKAEVQSGQLAAAANEAWPNWKKSNERHAVRKKNHE
jgi:hypothetical protein